MKNMILQNTSTGMSVRTFSRFQIATSFSFSAPLASSTLLHNALLSAVHFQSIRHTTTLDKMILIVVVIRHSKYRHLPSPHSPHTPRLIHILSSFKEFRPYKSEMRERTHTKKKQRKEGARKSIVQSVALRIDDDIRHKNRMIMMIL